MQKEGNHNCVKRRNWFWQKFQYLIQTSRAILLQNNSVKLLQSESSFIPKSSIFLMFYSIWKGSPLRGSTLFYFSEYSYIVSSLHRGMGRGGDWLWQTAKGVPPARCGEPRGCYRRHGASSQLSESFFPSPCCYLRARVDRNRAWKQEAACQDKGRDCL